MNYSDQRGLMEKLRAELGTVIDTHFADSKAEGLAERARVKKARGQRKCPKQGKGWTEDYHIQVKHQGEYDGRSATISIAGAERYFRVNQNHRMIPRYKGQALSTPATWNVYLSGEGNNDALTECNVTDFEAAVQQCIVALLGHVYYDL